MAVIRVNGYAVAGQIGFAGEVLELNSQRGHSPNGVYQLRRNGTVRSWRFTTRMLPRDEALALSYMLQQRGDAWRFDLNGSPDGVVYVSDDTVPEVWSDTRRVPRSAEAECTVISTYAADGSRVYDWNRVPYGPFAGSKGSLLVEPASANIATANQFDPSATTGFGALGVGVSLSVSPDIYWTGSSSVAATLPGSNQSEGISCGTFTGQTDYVVSGFIKLSPALISAAVSVRTQLYDLTAGTSLDFNDISPTDGDGFYRVYAAGSPAGGAGSNVEMRIFIGSNTTAGIIYLDGVQVEDDVKNGYPTAPIDPGTNPFGGSNGTRPAGELDFDQYISGYSKGLTIAAWVNVQYTGVAQTKYILDLGDSYPRAVLYIDSSDAAKFDVFARDASFLNPTSSALAVGWHFIVATYNPIDRTARVYVDGALAASDSAWSASRQFFDPSTISGNISIGTAGTAGVDTAQFPLGPIYVLPYAVPLNLISGCYQSATDDRPVPGLYPLSVSGDILGVGEKHVYCHARVRSIINDPHVVSGAWDGAAARVDFDLYEAEKMP